MLDKITHRVGLEIKLPAFTNSKKFRLSLAALLTLVIAFFLLSHLLSNKAQKEFENIYGNLSQLNATLICDNSLRGTHHSYDAFFSTRANPEGYLVGTAQKQGYDIASNLDLISRLSKSTSSNPTVLYSPENFYLLGNKQQFRLNLNIYQSGQAKFSCKDSDLNKTMGVDMNRPIVEVKVTEN